MHDVDLLPVNPQLKYVNPGDGFALHIASPKLHPKYHCKHRLLCIYSVALKITLLFLLSDETFVGGILILTVNDYKVIGARLYQMYNVYLMNSLYLMTIHSCTETEWTQQ